MKGNKKKKITKNNGKNNRSINAKVIIEKINI